MFTIMYFRAVVGLQVIKVERGCIFDILGMAIIKVVWKKVTKRGVIMKSVSVC